MSGKTARRLRRDLCVELGIDPGLPIALRLCGEQTMLVQQAVEFSQYFSHNLSATDILNAELEVSASVICRDSYPKEHLELATLSTLKRLSRLVGESEAKADAADCEHRSSV